MLLPKTPPGLIHPGRRIIGPDWQAAYGVRPLLLETLVDPTRFRGAAPDDSLADLEASGRQHVRVGEHRPVHGAMTSLRNQRKLLGYAGARRRGLPIGTGATEATCKSLFTVRMKRRGARWKEGTAGERFALSRGARSTSEPPRRRLERVVTLRLAVMSD